MFLLLLVPTLHEQRDAASSTLQDELDRLIFMNEGTVTKEDKYVYVLQKVSYMEPDNVTCSMCGWGSPAGGLRNEWAYIYRELGPSPNSTQPNVTTPPMGMRSSPALGGVSAGSTEMRADGSFRECGMSGL